MRFEDLSLTVRQRNPWEALDLGSGMVQQWWRAVYVGWFLMTLPVFIVLNIALHQHPVWVFIIMWWLKPFYDRVLLYIYSRAVFGQPLVIHELVRALPGLFYRTGLLLHLTIFRLDWSRAFRLPVWQLEGLDSKRRGARTNALARRAGGYAVWLLLACLHLELIIQLALFGLVWMFVPELPVETVWRYFWDIISGNHQFPYWIDLLSNIIFYIAMTLVEPLYVAGGFSLYLNRRTWLEGWDIEIVFRQLAARLERLAQKGGKAIVVILAVGMAGLMSYTPQAMAKDKEPLASYRLSPDKATEVIRQVKSHEDFGGKRTEDKWELNIEFEKSDSDDDISLWGWEWIGSLVRFIARVLEVLLWVAVVGLALWLAYRLSKGRYRSQSKTRQQRELPAVISGMDITPESLPDDVIAEAKRLWVGGQRRDALSLIYRATVSVLIYEDHIDLAEGATEGDVLRAARSILQSDRQDYLALLTRIWQQLAYAHRQPDEEHVGEIMRHWPQYFGRRKVNAGTSV